MPVRRGAGLIVPVGALRIAPMLAIGTLPMGTDAAGPVCWP
jgi:hypothetical protein